MNKFLFRIALSVLQQHLFKVARIKPTDIRVVQRTCSRGAFKVTAGCYSQYGPLCWKTKWIYSVGSNSSDVSENQYIN